ncbi:MAG: hypothetical protein ACLQLO_15645 [Mycobacterium sp.]
MTDQPEPAQDAVAAARALSRAAVDASVADGGVNHNLLAEATDVNAGRLDRDELLKLARLLTRRLAMVSMVAGSLIDQIPNRSTDRETLLYQFMAALEGPDDNG